MVADLIEAFQHRSKKLNKIEKLKSKKSPIDTLNQLEEYAKNGYQSIPKEDLDFFLKSFGIFDRNEPNSFMMRVRVPNGKLTPHQAKRVGEIAIKYGQDYIDITTRMQFQLRFLKIEDIPAVLKELDEIGLSPFQTGVDNIRTIITDPLNQFAKDSYIETDDIVLEMTKFFWKKPEWLSVLPRKFNIGINGSITNRANVFAQDLGFVLASKSGEYGFNVYLGGKVGETAKKTNIFVKNSDEVVLLFQTIITLFRDYGFRDNRNKNRLFYLLQVVGIEKFEEAIREVSNYNFATAGTTLVDVENQNRDGLVELRDNRYAKLVIVPSGIFSGSDMVKASQVADEVGGEIRLTYDQNLYIVGIEKDDLSKYEIFQKYGKFDNPYFQNMVACAGSKECPYGVIENKPDAIKLANYLSENVPLENNSIVRFHWSACPKGCGIHGIGDIGFEGVRVKQNGESVSGAHIFIGGKMGKGAREGKRLIKSAPLSDVNIYLSNLMKIYREMKNSNESFSEFESRVLSNYPLQVLEFILKFNRAFPELAPLKVIENFPAWKGEKYIIEYLGKEIAKRLPKGHKFEAVAQKMWPHSSMDKFCLSFPKLDKIRRLIMDICRMADTRELQEDRYSSISEVIKELERVIQ